MQKLWDFEFAFGSTPELVRSFRPHRSLRPNDRSLRSLFSRCLLCLLWCLSGLSPEIPRRWSGVSGPTGVSGLRTQNLRPQVFSAVLRLCGAALVLVRSIPGGCPDSPARPESPAPMTGISGPPRVRLDRSLRSLGPESPA